MHQSGIFGGIVAPAQPQLIMIMPAQDKQTTTYIAGCFIIKNQIYIWMAYYIQYSGYNYNVYTGYIPYRH